MNTDPSAGWIKADWSAPPGVHALTTTRGFDVGNRSGQASADMAASRRLIETATMGDIGRLQWLKQVHGDRCVRTHADSIGSQPEADVVWTTEPGIGLAIQTADCVPVALASADGRCIGAAHGGWRGLVSGVIRNLAAAMGSVSPDATLAAWLGPAIGPKAYEVGKDVHAAVLAATSETLDEQFFGAAGKPDKWRLDLFALAEWLLRQAGVERIACERICTWSNAHFYSHRRDGPTGRMATVVWIAQ